MRKGVNVIYVKASEQVADLLTFMGAGGAAMQIMDHKMFKELRNKTNRLNNCEMANIDKVVTANVAARKAIEYLQEKGDFDALPAPCGRRHSFVWTGRTCRWRSWCKRARSPSASRAFPTG